MIQRPSKLLRDGILIHIVPHLHCHLLIGGNNKRLIPKSGIGGYGRSVIDGLPVDSVSMPVATCQSRLSRPNGWAYLIW